MVAQLLLVKACCEENEKNVNMVDNILYLNVILYSSQWTMMRVTSSLEKQAKNRS